MRKYKSFVNSMIVLPEGEPIFTEMATVVGIDDASGGPLVTITQQTGDGDNRVLIQKEEWLAIRKAVDEMLVVCEQIESEARTK